MLTCMRMQHVCNIYYVVQELWAFSITAYGRNGQTHIVIRAQTQGSCNLGEIDEKPPPTNRESDMNTSVATFYDVYKSSTSCRFILLYAFMRK